MLFREDPGLMASRAVVSRTGRAVYSPAALPRSDPRLGNLNLRQERGALQFLSLQQQQMLTPSARQALMRTNATYGTNPSALSSYQGLTNRLTLNPGHPVATVLHEALHAVTRAGLPTGFMASLDPQARRVWTDAYYGAPASTPSSVLATARAEFGRDPLSGITRAAQAVELALRGTAPPGEIYAVMGENPAAIPAAQRQYFTNFYTPKVLGTILPAPTIAGTSRNAASAANAALRRSDPGRTYFGRGR